SLALMLPVLRLRHTTLTDVSPNSITARWCERWGFRVMESAVAVLPSPWSVFRTRNRRLRVVTDEEELERRLDGDELHLFCDHRLFPGCGGVLAFDGTERCFLIYSRVQRRTYRPYALVHHVSNPRFLARHSAALRAAVSRRAEVSFVVVDARLLCGERVP